MSTVRRLYILVVCAVSLQSVAWAIIALLRGLLAPVGAVPVTATAFQIALIVIGLPVFLVHWLWAQRLAGREPEERGSTLRRFYLYGTLAGLLGPFVANALTLLARLLWLGFGERGDTVLYPSRDIFRALSGMAVLGLLWYYHSRVVGEDARAQPELGSSATVRRAYNLGFSGTGVAMTTFALIHLLRWILLQFGSATFVRGLGRVLLTDEIARLSVGLAVWLLFWTRAQRMFLGPSEEERESALRKFYLYGVVFIAVLTAVSNATFILAGFFRRLLGLPPGGDIRDPLPILIGMIVLWAYHATVIRVDSAMAGEAPRQAGVRRLYLYLVAAVGLSAFLVGLGGNISVLIRLASTPFTSGPLREQLVWFIAALISGLPVWLLPWWRLQGAAVTQGDVGAQERRSVVRKIYLYFYLLVATLTVLSSTVYILFRLLSLALGERGEGNLVESLGQAISFTLIGLGLWLYHGFALRSDGQLNRKDQALRLAHVRVAVINAGEGNLGGAVVEGLLRELPGLKSELIDPTAPAAEATAQPSDIASRLANVSLIIAPWAIAAGVGGGARKDVAEAMLSSPARKLLIPFPEEGWNWAGVDRWSTDSLARHTVRAATQMLEGEEIRLVRPLGVGAAIGVVMAVLFLLSLLLIPLLYFFRI